MDILESREAALRAKVLGASPSSSPLPSVAVDQMSIIVSGSAKLRELYQEHAGQLQLTSASAFAHSSSRAGDELKRAAILSSTDRLQQVSAQLQQLQQLTRVLDQLRTPDTQQQTQLTQLEAQSELQSERALALHLRVEKVLATYQQMILVLSEKCVEYNSLLDQLQV
ncbi:Dynactin subunit p22 [Phytophthora cactorum]|nr:Dynactin subunit p22 [Phytophthora cactorum]